MILQLNNKLVRVTLNTTSDTWVGALSSFDKPYGWDGKNYNISFCYPMFSLTLDNVIEKFNLILPDYIKIDVVVL